jgi:MFS family permease
MMKSSVKRKLIGSLIGFTIAAVSAAIFQWRAQELIWCFWAGSLGISTIGTFILVGLSIVEERRRKSSENNIVLGLLLGAGIATVLTIFHNSYGKALNAWFPLGEGISTLPQIIGAAFVSYWTIILASMFAQFISYPRRGLLPAPKGSESEDDDEFNDPFLEPFRNIARLFIIVLILTGIDKKTDILNSEIASTTEWLIIYAVLLISFFPFIPIGKKRTRS